MKYIILCFYMVACGNADSTGLNSVIDNSIDSGVDSGHDSGPECIDNGHDRDYCPMHSYCWQGECKFQPCVGEDNTLCHGQSYCHEGFCWQ